MPTELRTKTLVELLRSIQSKTQVGKTQLQKLIYFVQEAGVLLGYKYEIYHYGPYCFELNNDLSSLDSLRILSVEADPTGYGFNICMDEFAKNYEADKQTRRKVHEIADRLGKDTASQLEVKATIHFVKKVMDRRAPVNIEIVLAKVRDLKPHFAEHFVRKCYEELQHDKLIG